MSCFSLVVTEESCCDHWFHGGSSQKTRTDTLRPPSGLTGSKVHRLWGVTVDTAQLVGER